MKVFDIVQPKDNWGRNYAHLEYLKLGLGRCFRKTIEVKNG